VHLTCGILRGLQAFFWLRVFSTSQTESTPAHTQVTQPLDGIFFMNAKEEYETKRKNFRSKALELFGFLVGEFGYSKPILTKAEQKNGVVISDRFEYRNESIDRLILVHNDYHPVDYGFAIEIYRPSISERYGDGILAFHILKEDQDINQWYLLEAAKVFRDQYQEVIAGRDWPMNQTGT
jgi:hypothetical protein